MLRICLLASALCVALTTTLGAGSAGEIQVIPPRADVMAAASGVPAESWACSPIVTAPEPSDDSARWRWATYRHLDCATDVIDHALTSANDEGRTVTLTREELDRLRNRVFWAKDAAARIGR
jgi:hypothetical protein